MDKKCNQFVNFKFNCWVIAVQLSCGLGEINANPTANIIGGCERQPYNSKEQIILK